MRTEGSCRCKPRSTTPWFSAYPVYTLRDNPHKRNALHGFCMLCQQATDLPGKIHQIRYPFCLVSLCAILVPIKPSLSARGRSSKLVKFSLQCRVQLRLSDLFCYYPLAVRILCTLLFLSLKIRVCRTQKSGRMLTAITGSLADPTVRLKWCEVQPAFSGILLISYRPHTALSFSAPGRLTSILWLLPSCTVYAVHPRQANSQRHRTIRWCTQHDLPFLDALEPSKRDQCRWRSGEGGAVWGFGWKLLGCMQARKAAAVEAVYDAILSVCELCVLVWSIGGVFFFSFLPFFLFLFDNGLSLFIVFVSFPFFFPFSSPSLPFRPA